MKLRCETNNNKCPMLLVDLYMNTLSDFKDCPPPINYAEMYRHYLASLCQMSARIGKDQPMFGVSPVAEIPSPLSPAKKCQNLWSPAKLVEMESSESGEELGSGLYCILISHL